MTRKGIIIIIVSIAIIAAVIKFGYEFAPGVDPNAELYEINISEDELIQIINDFKNENPQYIPPSETQLEDGRRDENDYTYNVYFFYPKDMQILYTWLRPLDSKNTTLAFVAINDGLILGNWKDINKDFSRSENKEQKKKFEEIILNNLKTKIRERQQ